MFGLRNNVFDLQLHYKTTAAFVVNKFFYYNKFDLNIHKTYIHFLRKYFYFHIHIFRLYFDVKPISQNS